MSLDLTKTTTTYKSKRLFHAMCYSATDQCLERIMKEEDLLTEYWYRFEDRTTAALLDDNGKPIGSERINIDLYRYKVLRHTKKGVWIEFGFEKDRFVLKDARKRFACSTVEEAERSFIARKERQLSILRVQMNKVNYVLAEAKTVMNVMNLEKAAL